jgi:hypothetical protein
VTNPHNPLIRPMAAPAASAVAAPTGAVSAAAIMSTRLAATRGSGSGRRLLPGASSRIARSASTCMADCDTTTMRSTASSRGMLSAMISTSVRAARVSAGSTMVRTSSMAVSGCARVDVQIRMAAR